MKTTTSLILTVFTSLALAASAYAQSPRKQLNQMVEQLQRTPDDDALRMKIIGLARGAKPSPAIPEEANRAFVKGNAYQQEAKDASGYDLAIAAYREALRVAPWWGNVYHNLSVALEAAGKYDEAIASTKHYMASVTAKSAGAREAQNRVYALEVKSEMAARQKSAQAAAEAERNRPSVEGRWTDGNTEFQITRSGDSLSLVLHTLFVKLPGYTVASNVVELDSRRAQFNATTSLNAHRPNSFDLSLSAGGDELAGTLANDAGRQQIRFTRIH